MDTSEGTQGDKGGPWSYEEVEQFAEWLAEFHPEVLITDIHWEPRGLADLTVEPADGYPDVPPDLAALLDKFENSGDEDIDSDSDSDSDSDNTDHPALEFDNHVY